MEENVSVPLPRKYPHNTTGGGRGAIREAREGEARGTQQVEAGQGVLVVYNREPKKQHYTNSTATKKVDLKRSCQKRNTAYPPSFKATAENLRVDARPEGTRTWDPPQHRYEKTNRDRHHVDGAVDDQAAEGGGDAAHDGEQAAHADNAGAEGVARGGRR